jgi:diguanylate cyclase (GGDEF)-like protein
MTARTRNARAPAASRQELEAALREIEALRTQGSLLIQQVALLAQEVARARQFAHHDGLTGLPNRRLLLDRYNQAVAVAARQHRQVALLFLDLDGFKRVNDAYGHAAGDSVLQQVAARLRACIRTSDTACRYGGDEFVILLPQYEGQESAAAVADKVCAHLAAPYAVGGTAISVTASIGMAVYPIDGHEYGDLMQVTDRAMYRDKVRGDAAPSDLGARLSTRRRADGIDRNEEHRNETCHTEIHASGEEIRSGTGRSLQ